MTAYDFEKQKRLLALAEQDYPYTVWETCRKEFESAFYTFADSQPEEIRNMLLGYAGAGDMINQRIINIACENMDFINKGGTDKN